MIDRCLGEKLLRMSKEDTVKRFFVLRSMQQKSVNILLPSQAKHPNIAVYLDMLEGAKNFYIVMEAALAAMEDLANLLLQHLSRCESCLHDQDPQ